jgi:hypothetical protein
VLAHLWTGKPAPFEYTRLRLCRDVYHCDPETFYKIPAKYLVQDLAMLTAEAQARKAKTKK